MGQRAEERAAEELPPGAGETVLFVEDEPLVLRTTSRLLARQGFRVLQASSAEQALELVAAGEATPAAVVTDLALSGIDGRELARRLTGRWPELAVVYTSGSDSLVMLERAARGHRRARVLAKPYTPRQLIAALRELLER